LATGTYKRPLLIVDGKRYELKVSDKAEASVADSPRVRELQHIWPMVCGMGGLQIAQAAWTFPIWKYL